MTNIIVVQGPTGTVHVADIEEVEETFDLPAYQDGPHAAPVHDPVEEDAVYGTSFDPHRQQVLEEISLGGISPCTVREHRRELRADGHPAHPTKWHK